MQPSQNFQQADEELLQQKQRAASGSLRGRVESKIARKCFQDMGTEAVAGDANEQRDGETPRWTSHRRFDDHMRDDSDLTATKRHMITSVCSRIESCRKRS
jgi:hypothetical protein